jgi:PiT family inorganic phosphate transporter
MTTTIIILVALAVVFDFLCGILDSSNIVATMVSSRAFSPRVALSVTAVAGFLGPFLFGVAVAKTFGNDVVEPASISIVVIFAALASAILWCLITWFLGIPSSSSHALIGGLIGAVAIGSDFGAIQLGGLEKVLFSLFVSPLVGFVVGFLLARLVYFLSLNSTPKINWFFKRSQILTAIALAFSHGTNGAQKTMGIVTLGLIATGNLVEFEIPTWVIFACASAIASGTVIGGWRLIKTLGAKFFKIKPVDGFNSQLASAIVILGASLLGGPVSTTQVVSSTIMGVGSAERVSKVRWGVVKDILIAWLVTIPATAVVAAGIYWVITYLTP